MIKHRQIRLSFSKFTGTWTASSENATYLVSNLGSPQRPFLPWKTTALGEQWARIDFGSAKTVNVLALIAANFASARIQANSVDLWTSPPYDQAITIGRNPWTGRYQHAHRPASLTYRYVRILIPSQPPIDGASVYSLGGVWAGALSTTPRNILWGVTVRVVEPHADVMPDHEGWRQRLILGEPIAQIDADRFGVSSPRKPADGDELETWLDLDRQSWDADVFLIDLNRLDASQVWPVRRLSPRDWTLRMRRARSPWLLEEVVAP